jgi:hypothetical protein
MEIPAPSADFRPPRDPPRGPPRNPPPPGVWAPNLGPRIPGVGAAVRNLRFGTQLICITKKFLAKCFEYNHALQLIVVYRVIRVNR